MSHFSLGGSKQQQISNHRGSGSGLALATNPFHCLSTYHGDSSAEEDEDLTRKIAECDLKQVTPGKHLMEEGGTLFCDNRLDQFTKEVEVSTGEYIDKELLCGFGNMEGDIPHDNEPVIIRMDNVSGVNLVYVKDSNDDLSELLRKQGRKYNSYDYVYFEEPHPWCCIYSVVGVLPETQSQSLSCNLEKDQQDNRPMCTEGDTEPRLLAVASEGTEVHIDTEHLDLEKEIMNLGGHISSEDADIYGDQISFKRSPAEFWVGRDFQGYKVSKPEEIDKINRKLAVHRIKAYELSKGIHLDGKKLKICIPDTFKERDYFVDYEEEFEWFFHPEYCNLAGLDDYQRLVPKQQQLSEYLHWNNYHQILSDYASDKEYLEYCKGISKQLQWLKKYILLHPESFEWMIVDDKALTQALKVATEYPCILPSLVWNAYQEYLWWLRVYSKEHDALHGLYFEVWKRFAKEKKSFKDALKEVDDHNLFPVCGELSTGHTIEDGIEHQFNTSLAGIDDAAPDSEVHEKIEKAVQNLIQKKKFYEQYAEKKIAIAKSIGLVS